MVKFYNNGKEFLEENIDLLDYDILFKPFYLVDSELVDEFTNEKYIFVIKKENVFAAILNDGIHNLLAMGDKSLAKEVAQVLFGYNLKVNKILGNFEIVNEIANEYLKLMGGSYEITLDMDMMTSNTINPNYPEVEKASSDDIKTINEYYINFAKEAINEEIDYNVGLERITKTIDDYYVIKQDGLVVSMAKTTRNFDKTCAISNVYTNPLYRGKGLCKKLVSVITNDILKQSKIANLDVDRKNPISNAAYKAIGYKVLYRQTELVLKRVYKTMVISGGCFWCMSKPFYEYDGVKFVYSGYTNGFTINPTYQEVKSQNTGHKEAVMIVYDPNIISYKELLTVFFENIDPFDGEGQFIDRGSNYETAVYTTNQEEISIYNELVDRIEKEYQKKVLVPLLKPMPFYMAEEYHQDFHLNNPEKFNEEEEISGRNAFQFVKLK